MHFRSVRAAWLLLLWSAMVGCGTQATGPPLIEASGVVTLDGAPVEGATVFFHPAKQSGGSKAGGDPVGGDPVGGGKSGGGKTGVGETDAEGRFSIETHIKAAGYQSGVVAGDYLVTVEKLEGEQRKSTLVAPKNTLPRRYQDPQSSKLTATVASDGANAFEFALQK